MQESYFLKNSMDSKYLVFDSLSSEKYTNTRKVCICKTEYIFSHEIFFAIISWEKYFFTSLEIVVRKDFANVT